MINFFKFDLNKKILVKYYWLSKVKIFKVIKNTNYLGINYINKKNYSDIIKLFQNNWNYFNFFLKKSNYNLNIINFIIDNELIRYNNLLIIFKYNLYLNMFYVICKFMGSKYFKYFKLNNIFTNYKYLYFS